MSWNQENGNYLCINLDEDARLENLKTFSESAGKFTCCGCGKNYRYRRDLLRHQRLVCGKEPQFVCPYCDKRCSYKSGLKWHIKHHHKAYVV